MNQDSGIIEKPDEMVDLQSQDNSIPEENFKVAIVEKKRSFLEDLNYVIKKTIREWFIFLFISIISKTIVCSMVNCHNWSNIWILDVTYVIMAIFIYNFIEVFTRGEKRIRPAIKKGYKLATIYILSRFLFMRNMNDKVFQMEIVFTLLILIIFNIVSTI